MKDGFIKVAAGIPEIHVADTIKNSKNIKDIILKANEKKVNLIVFPELCITGYTCGDLFFNRTLLSNAEKALLEITEFTADKYPTVVLGLPLVVNFKTYNCAAVVQKGKIIGIVPKSYIPDYLGFNEKRYFESGIGCSSDSITLSNNTFTVIFGNDLIFSDSEYKDFTFGVEICEDLFSPEEINRKSALSGANIIVNPAACNYTVGKDDYCKLLVSSSSARLNCGYILVSAGSGESTMDMVFAGHALIAENGKIIAENKPFTDNDILISEIDLELLSLKRRQNTSFSLKDNCRTVYFEQKITDTEITRNIPKYPFIPANMNINTLAEQILQIQSYGLKKRLSHTNSSKAVIGISGGLDSTLALLVTVRAIKLLNRPMTDILCITMPCLGTTERTRSNSERLCKILGAEFREINITYAVKQHFADIGQVETDYNTVFENSQARERTQVLMDIANKTGGLVIGTGDLSESALGWMTYNGDHMSMYSVNCSVPKTLIRHIIRFEAEQSENELKEVLLDILDTPVSPELLPADDNGNISQKTEDLIGPYNLHDFFLYHMVHLGESPKKIFRLASLCFVEYDKSDILHWLTVFTKRFFSQQFKRSCLPDGPFVTNISLSPRGAWKMPSDATSAIWLKELEKIKAEL